MTYRLVVGEQGNEMGHIVSTKAKTLRGAQVALGLQLAKYGRDGWGRIEWLAANGEWFSWYV